MAEEAKGAAGAGLEERVKSLEEALAMEKAKNEVLMEQVLKSENSLAEKDVEGFADVIPNEDREFWRGQLMENREAAVGVLNRMRERAHPGEKPEGAAGSGQGGPSASAGPSTSSGRAAPKPLHNRETAPRPSSTQGAPAGSPTDKAAKIRNRAQEIARRDGCSFTVAFRSAEQEFGATS
jgi:hypothetical protein